jgi:hypothetical protein
MTPSRWRLLGLVVAVTAFGLWQVMSRSGAKNQIDLLAKLPEAKKLTNVVEGPQFVVETVTIDGETKRTVLARTSSRLIFPLTITRDAWFDVSFAMKPETWDQPGDGAQFRVGVSDGRVYEELLKQYVDPRRGDRRWFSARLDLSAYEGRQVTLILNTDPGLPGSLDKANDLAVWAEPRVYTKR